MSEPGTIRVEETPTSIGLGSNVHSPGHRYAAIASTVGLIGLAVLAAHFGSIQGPESKPFLPIVATMWALADLMTAFLLLAQFYVSGTTFLTVLAAAYALGGLLTLPYLVAFPGLFRTGTLSVADQQISIYIWIGWHATFPIMVGCSALWDSKLGSRMFSRTGTRNAIWTTILSTVFVAAAFTATIVARSGALPQLVLNGHFAPVYGHVVAPGVALLNAAACLLLLRRGRAMTTLQVWLFVAIFTAMLDALLNASSPSRYSVAWYVGKFETVLTASVVLFILLCEVTGLYRKLADMATIDPLTQLRNRRALDEHIGRMFGDARRRKIGIGIIVVDVDFFKGFNDRYGHAEGDECLRRVAASVRAAATRPLDLVARYGGEEFVVLVPETPREGVVAVAERVLACVEAASIPYPDYAHGHITVSAGVGYVSDARNIGPGQLFELADAALYEAKARGRNRFVVASSGIAASQGREAAAG